MNGIFSEVLGALKILDVCSITVGPSSMQFISQTAKYTAISICDCRAAGTGTPLVYSTEALLSAIAECSFIEEINGSLIFTCETENYTLVNTIQPLLLDVFSYEIPEEWNTRVTMEVEVFKKFINLQPEAETSIYLSNGILYFCTDSSTSTDVIQINELDILLEGIDKVTVHFSSLKYLSGLLRVCEKISMMYTKEYFSIVLLFKDDIAQYRIIFSGII